MKRFAIAALLPALVAPALIAFLMDIDLHRDPIFGVGFFFCGGAFTLCFSLPYAVVLDSFYPWSKTRPGSAGGAIVAIVLGFCAGAIAAVLLANLLAWGPPPGLNIDRGLLATLGGLGAAIGTFVAALVFVVERRSRATR